jgi:hypothetical protein
MKVARTIRTLLCSAGWLPLASAAHADILNGPDVRLFLEGGMILGHGDIAYAQFYDGLDNYPFEVSPGDGWSGRAGIGVGIAPKLEAILAYRQSNTLNDDDSGVWNETNTNGAWPIFNILGIENPADDPLASGATSWSQATVDTDVKAQMLDFLIGYDLGLGETASELTILAGLRYLRVDQDTDMALWCVEDAANCPASSVLQLTQSRKSQFEGMGPEIGARFSKPLDDHGVSIAGHLLGAVIFGKQETETFSIWFDGTNENTATYSDNHLAYSLDGRLGLSYAPDLFPGAMEWGYRFTYLANVRDTRNEQAANADDIFGSRSDNYFEHGPYMRLTFNLH